MARSDSHITEEAVLLALGCFVLVSWVLLVAVGVAFPKHALPNAVHGIVLVVATGLFGRAALASKKNGGGDP